jgi:protein-disulfide isomerase
VPAYVRSAATRKRNPVLYWLIGVLAVAAVAVTWILLSSKGDDAPGPANSPPAPSATASPLGQLSTPPAGGEWIQQAVLDGEAVAFGSPTAPVEVETYFDFICPFCGVFERANAADLRELVNSGRVRMKAYVINFQDYQSRGTRYSTRAASAWLETVQQAPAAAFDFMEALFENQPAEGTEGLTDSAIAALATTAGVPAAVSASFDGFAWDDWVTAANEVALREREIGGTPRVFIGGERFMGDIYTAGPLRQAIEDAARG